MIFQYKLLKKQEIKNLKGKEGKAWKRAMNETMSTFLVRVRLGSLRHIRENPNRLGYKALPSLPNRLTHRTGAMKLGILEGSNKGNELSGWTKLTTMRASTDPSIYKTFFGKVVNNGTKYEGTWSPYVRDGSASLKHLEKIFAKRSRRPDSSTIKESIAWRLRHEHRGRPYLMPSAQELIAKDNFNKVAREKFLLNVINPHKYLR